MKPVVYSLFDSWSQRHLSNHTTLANALKARVKYAKKWRKGNVVDAFIQYKILKSDDTFITDEELAKAAIAASI